MSILELNVSHMEQEQIDESTKIEVDLEKELSEEELVSFREQAREAGASSLKEHFLNLNLKALKPVA